MYRDYCILDELYDAWLLDASCKKDERGKRTNKK